MFEPVKQELAQRCDDVVLAPRRRVGNRRGHFYLSPSNARHPGLDPGSMNTDGEDRHAPVFMDPDFRQDDDEEEERRCRPPG
jgi:hypothetical protein